MQTKRSEPLKDPTNAHPVSELWRPILRRIVESFDESNYELSKGIPSVAPVSRATLGQIREYITDYGESLIDLPDDAWDTSVSQWMGTHWDVLVDLWTLESGRSDLVLAVRVFDVDGEYQFEIDSVHVP